MPMIVPLLAWLVRILGIAKPAILPIAIRGTSMNPIVSTVVSLCIPYVVGELTSEAGTIDWAGVKTKAHAAVAGAVHSALADKVIDDAIDGVLDAAAKICQDKPDIQAALTALAKSDKAAAIQALEAMVAKVLPPELGVLLTAA